MNENTPPVAAREHTVESFTKEFLRELNFSQGVDLDRASDNDKYLALAKTVRHYLMTRWLETLRNQYTDQAKTVAYLSAEFLLGPQLENSMLAADLDAIAAEPLNSLGRRHRGRCAPSRSSQALATAASAAWRRASSTRSRR